MTSLDRSLGYSLRRAQLSTYAEFNGFMEPFNIRPSQYSALMLIHSNPGLTQSAVAASLSIQKANLVSLLDELQSRGLLERRKSAGDRRAFALHLTAAGRLLAKKIERSHSSMEAKIRKRLGEERSEELLELLHAFTGHTRT